MCDDIGDNNVNNVDKKKKKKKDSDNFRSYVVVK